MRFILALIIGLLLAPGTADADALIYLIRHAEKVDDGSRDPDLSKAGTARAIWYRDYFAAMDVTSLRSTDFKRTRNTLQPLAEALGLDLESYNPFDLNAVADELREEEGIIVVVGHSNTTPALVNALIGEDRFAELDEAWMYDRIFLVRIDGEGETSVEHLYSEPRSVPMSNDEPD